jgi:hypothetical protein
VPADVFDRPVNVLDNFVPYRPEADVHEADVHEAGGRENLMTQRIEALEVDLQRANQEIVGLRRQIGEMIDAGQVVLATRQTDQMARELAALYASTSWRITRPLRALAHPRRTLKILLRRVLS